MALLPTELNGHMTVPYPTFVLRLPTTACAGIPGFEPRMAVPETAVLPVTPYPNVVVCQVLSVGADPTIPLL